MKHIVPKHIPMMTIDKYMKRIVPLPQILKIKGNIYRLNNKTDKVNYRFKWKIVDGELTNNFYTYGQELEFLTELEFMEDWFEYFI